MNELSERLRQHAATRKRRIALADTHDERMLRAASAAQRDGLAEIVLVGRKERILKTAAQIRLELTDAEIVDPTAFDLKPLAERLHERRPDKVPSVEHATNLLRQNELLFAASLVGVRSVDGALAGAASTTADVIRAALLGIGIREGLTIVSSFFLMEFDALEGRREGFHCAFADCGVVVDPTAEQLAEIGVMTARSYHNLTHDEPRVAFLSFSTKGSARSESTLKVVSALELAKGMDPTLMMDGELQFDAAFVPEVTLRKAPGSDIEGKANVFVFPNLDAGNIAYKIAERLGMGIALGPILQGLRAPMNDLSRGASVEDIVTMIAVTALQSI